MTGGLSFRSIFELTCNLQATSSNRRRIETKRLGVLAPEFIRDRHLENEAMRRFCHRIQLLDDSPTTKEMFSCKTCEVDLTTEDCDQIGIDESYMQSMKRFESLVIYGKVIGALMDYPVTSEHVLTLVGTKRLKSKILEDRPTRGSLMYFLKSVRLLISAVEYGWGSEVTNNLVKNGSRILAFSDGEFTWCKGCFETKLLRNSTDSQLVLWDEVLPMSVIAVEPLPVTSTLSSTACIYVEKTDAV